MTKAVLQPFEVSEKEIQRLEPGQLVALVKRLLDAEAQAFGIPLAASQGTFLITVADGGEDRRIEWQGGPDRTDYVPRRFTVFQIKAENLTTTKLAAAQVDGKGSAARLKPAVVAALDKAGAYIVVTSKTNVTTPKKRKPGQPKKQKIDELKETLRASIETHTPAEKKASLPALETGVYGPPQIMDWVNRHRMIAVWVRQQLGHASANFTLETIEGWSAYQDHQSSAFVRTAEIDTKLADIRDALSGPRRVVRLLGHSGLGKSRLVFEALSAPGAARGVDFAPIVAYARSASDAGSQHLEDFIHNRMRAVIVVDDCPPAEHRRLSNLVRRLDSNLSLVTLDYEFDDPPPNDVKIILERAPDEVVTGILKESGLFNVDDDLKGATNFCAGFPQIAVMVVEAFKDGAQHFAQFKDQKQISERLIWGRSTNHDSNASMALCATALFTAVGCEPPKSDQFEWIATQLFRVDVDELERRLKQFELRQIVQRRGYSLLVQPRPLAASLAALFWRDATKGQRAALLSGNMPNQLKEAMCERLADLNYLSDARAIAAKLCGQTGPFGTAEALNTETGARCLRQIAEVAPDEVMTTIEFAFGSWSVDRLKRDLVAGRRAIIWTLEAVVWLPEIFDRAMDMLLRLAISDGESRRDSSAAEFTEKFRVQLPSTSTNLVQRLQYLQRSVRDVTDDDERRILVRAMGRALDDSGAVWVTGSQVHGTMIAHQHHRPKIWQEIFDYVRGVLSLLRKIANDNPSMAEACRIALTSASPGLVLQDSVISEYEATLTELAPSGRVWSEILEKLSWNLRHDLASETLGDLRKRVRQLYERFMPRTLAERIQYYVKSAPYNLVDLDEPDERSTDLAERRAGELGEEGAANWDVIAGLLPDLSSGESRQGFAFGRALYRKSTNPASVFEAVKAAFKAAPVGDRNASLLGGVIAAMWDRDPAAAQGAVVDLADEASLKRFLPYFAVLKLTERSLSLLGAAVAADEIEPGALHILGMGRVLDPMPDAAIEALVVALLSTGTAGAWVAIDLLGMSSHQRPERFQALKAVVEQTLTVEGLLASGPSESMATYHFEMLAGQLLADKVAGPRFAQRLATTIVDTVGDDEFSKRDRLLDTLSSQLLIKYPNVCLPIFVNAIETKDALQRFRLRTILASPFSFSGKKEGALFRLPQDVLLQACRSSKQFTLFVAEVAPLFNVSGEDRTWSDLARALLDEFGNRKAVLDALVANIGTGGWSGPTSLYLRSFVPPMEELTGHHRKEVAQWARTMLGRFRKQIESEEREEAEWDLRHS